VHRCQPRASHAVGWLAIGSRGAHGADPHGGHPPPALQGAKRPGPGLLPVRVEREKRKRTAATTTTTTTTGVSLSRRVLREMEGKNKSRIFCIICFVREQAVCGGGHTKKENYVCMGRYKKSKGGRFLIFFVLFVIYSKDVFPFWRGERAGNKSQRTFRFPCFVFACTSFPDSATDVCVCVRARGVFCVILGCCSCRVSCELRVVGFFLVSISCSTRVLVPVLLLFLSLSLSLSVVRARGLKMRGQRKRCSRDKCVARRVCLKNIE